MIAASPTITIIGLLSFHFGRDYFFDNTTNSRERVEGALEQLKKRHVEVIGRLFDNDFFRYFPEDIQKTREELAHLQGLRQEEILTAVDALWEDALQARRLETHWQSWGQWERNGRKMCELGRLLNFAIILLFVLGLILPLDGLSPGVWIMIAVIMIAIPFGFSCLAWFRNHVFEEKTLSFLDAPGRGMPATRRFGDA